MLALVPAYPMGRGRPSVRTTPIYIEEGTNWQVGSPSRPGERPCTHIGWWEQMALGASSQVCERITYTDPEMTWRSTFSLTLDVG